jgi:hypothetical protein
VSASANPQRWGCPNDPPCGHYWHDVYDFDDPVPTCCHEGCNCGKTDEHKRLRHELLYAAPANEAEAPQ